MEDGLDAQRDAVVIHNCFCCRQAFLSRNVQRFCRMCTYSTILYCNRISILLRLETVVNEKATVELVWGKGQQNFQFFFWSSYTAPNSNGLSNNWNGY